MNEAIKGLLVQREILIKMLSETNWSFIKMNEMIKEVNEQLEKIDNLIKFLADKERRNKK